MELAMVDLGRMGLNNKPISLGFTPSPLYLDQSAHGEKRSFRLTPLIRALFLDKSYPQA